VNQSACPDSTTAKIKIIPSISATVSVLHDTVCPYGSSTLTATGLGGPVTYRWSNGKTSSSINVTDTATTKYIATVYGICDSVKDTVTIHVVKLPVPVITGAGWRCLNGKDTLMVSGGSTYKWSNGSTSTSYITGPIKGDSTITVTAYNSLGCPKDTTFTVSLRTTSVTLTTAPLACAGSQVVIGAFEAGNGVTYKWAPGGETTDSITVNNSTATTYTVTVNNGCPVKVTIPVTADSPVLTACCDKVILIGDDTTIVAHGDSILSFNWSPSVDCLNPICDSVNVKPTVTTTYTVVGKDRNGCETEQIITIIVETPCFNFIVPNVFTPTNPGTLGLDNVFYIKTENLNAWSIVIFDRWGKEMYKSSNPNQYWDGKTEGGGEAPSGVYYYIINATCQGNTYKKQGFVQLIR
jgi:gliding motility-associated-like protein